MCSIRRWRARKTAESMQQEARRNTFRLAGGIGWFICVLVLNQANTMALSFGKGHWSFLASGQAPCPKHFHLASNMHAFEAPFWKQGRSDPQHHQHHLDLLWVQNPTSTKPHEMMLGMLGMLPHFFFVGWMGKTNHFFFSGQAAKTRRFGRFGSGYFACSAFRGGSCPS